MQATACRPTPSPHRQAVAAPDLASAYASRPSAPAIATAWALALLWEEWGKMPLPESLHVITGSLLAHELRTEEDWTKKPCILGIGQC